MGMVSSALGKGGSSKAPAAPDYKGAAIATSNANRFNTSGPYGTGTWSLRPGADPNNPQVGDWLQTTTLSDGQQKLYDQGVSNKLATGQAGAALIGDIGDRRSVADALYGRATQYMDQNFGDQQAMLESRLQNQGLTQGSEAYERAMRNFSQTRNQAYEGAANSAVINADTAQNNAVSRIAQLLSATQETNPQTAGTGGGADLLGATTAAGNASLGSWNAQQAGKDASFGNMLGLLQAGMQAYQAYNKK